MPLEIECHTIPHLKGLSSFLEASTMHGVVVLLHYIIPLLLHKQAKQRFHMNVAVCKNVAFTDKTPKIKTIKNHAMSLIKLLNDFYYKSGTK